MIISALEALIAAQENFLAPRPFPAARPLISLDFKQS